MKDTTALPMKEFFEGGFWMLDAGCMDTGYMDVKEFVMSYKKLRI
jgi:hypothetical protein